MGKHVYAVPIAGTPYTGDDEPPMHPAVDHSAQPSNYCQHYRWRADPPTVYIASDVRIPTLAEHDDVTELDPEEQNLSAYHTPSELAEQRGVAGADGDDEADEGGEPGEGDDADESDDSDGEQPSDDDEDSDEEDSSEDETKESSDDDEDSDEEDSSEEDGE